MIARTIMTFRSAIVCPPSATYADGITTGSLGRPDLAKALAQHAAYVSALERCGLRIIALEPDPRHPDSTFVEDTAVIAPGGPIIARPGAPERRGETDATHRALQGLASPLRFIEPPGTLDGGDVCEVGKHHFIGVSERTNDAGARQLAGFLAVDGCTSALVDIRGLDGLLHLKSGLASLGGGRLIADRVLSGHPALAGYEIIVVADAERYAANCLLLNGHVLVPRGFPRLEAELRARGEEVVPLDMSEFQKMDGGLSCLSLRLPTP